MASTFIVQEMVIYAGLVHYLPAHTLVRLYHMNQIARILKNTAPLHGSRRVS